MNRKELLEKYIREEDALLVSKVLDKIKEERQSKRIVTTNFLDLAQQKIVVELLAKLKIREYVLLGGFQEAERKILMIYPEKLQEVFKNKIPEIQKYLSYITIQLPNSLRGKYSHRDYLGGIMKLGIKREMIGDILVKEEGAGIIAIPDIEEYLMYHLQELKRFQKSEIKKENIECIKEIVIEREKIEILVSSMRLDNIVSELIKGSRKKANEMIAQERVFINFQIEKKNTKEIKKGDWVTIRGKGRFQIGDSIRSTKSERKVIEIYKFK